MPKSLTLSRANLYAAIESWLTPFKGIPSETKITAFSWDGNEAKIWLAPDNEYDVKVKHFDGS